MLHISGLMCSITKSSLFSSYYMSRDGKYGVFGVNANSTDPNQPAEIYLSDQEFSYIALSFTVPNDSISGR